MKNGRSSGEIAPELVKCEGEYLAFDKYLL
jgi:hypothetical protein